MTLHRFALGMSLSLPDDSLWESGTVLFDGWHLPPFLHTWACEPLFDTTMYATYMLLQIRTAINISPYLS